MPQWAALSPARDKEIVVHGTEAANSSTAPGQEKAPPNRDWAALRARDPGPAGPGSLGVDAAYGHTGKQIGRMKYISD